MYYLTKFDDVVNELCKPFHNIADYSTFISPFKSRNCGKEGEKIQKFEYLENEGRFLGKIKSIFHSYSTIHNFS